MIISSVGSRGCNHGRSKGFPPADIIPEAKVVLLVVEAGREKKKNLCPRKKKEKEKNPYAGLYESFVPPQNDRRKIQTTSAVFIQFDTAVVFIVFQPKVEFP